MKTACTWTAMLTVIAASQALLVIYKHPSAMWLWCGMLNLCEAL